MGKKTKKTSSPDTHTPILQEFINNMLEEMKTWPTPCNFAQANSLTPPEVTRQNAGYYSNPLRNKEKVRTELLGKLPEILGIHPVILEAIINLASQEAKKILTRAPKTGSEKTERDNENPNLIPIGQGVPFSVPNEESNTEIEEPINVQDDNTMIIDLGDQPQQSMVTLPKPPSPNTQPSARSLAKKNRGKVYERTLDNNIVSDGQKGQVKTIMIYDIPASWSHQTILEHLASWGRVLKISFKTQHKYQSVWTQMVLSPLASTDYILRKWWRWLGDTMVRWYPGNWSLKDRKVREQFQLQVTFPLLQTVPIRDDRTFFSDIYEKDQTIMEYYNAKFCKRIRKRENEGLINQTFILYFDSQDTLLNALEKKPGNGAKLSKSSTPIAKKKEKKSSKSDKKGKKDTKEKKKDRKKPAKSKKPGDKQSRSFAQKLLKILIEGFDLDVRGY